jgi:transcriptional regulator with XRE-family HTH domain
MQTSDETEHRTEALRLFGDMTRKQRQKSRWTQGQLAEQTEIDVAIVSAVELGEDAASETQLETLCLFLGMKIDTFPKLLVNVTRENQEAQRSTDVWGPNVVDLLKRRNQWQPTTSPPRD